MATHYLPSANVDCVNLILSQWRYLKKNIQKCLLSSPLCFMYLWSKSLYLIGCRGGKKRQFSEKCLKNLLLRNHKEDEAETWHTCLGHYPLQKLCFLFRSDKNSGCYGNLKLS